MGAHNNRIEAKNQKIGEKRPCSCPKKKGNKEFNCKFGKSCLEEGIIYQAKGENFNYIGLTKGNIKARISKHEHSFKNVNKEHETTLSTLIWQKSRKGENTNLEWSKLTNGRPRGPNQKVCNLCNKEAIAIMNCDNQNINLKSELGGFCPHRRWHLISHIKSNRVKNKRKDSND